MTVFAPPITAGTVGSFLPLQRDVVTRYSLFGASSDSSGIEYAVVIEENSGTIEMDLTSLGTEFEEIMTLLITDVPVQSEHAVWLRQAEIYLKSLSDEELTQLKLMELSLRDAWGDEDAIWDEV